MRSADRSHVVGVVIVNALSLLRLAAAPVFPALSPWGRIILVVASGITDKLDGVLARRWHAQTRFGQIIDALADKAVALVAFVTLAVEGELGWPWIPLLVSREIALAIALAVVALTRTWGLDGMEHPYIGKLATAVDFALLVGLLLFPNVTALRWTLLIIASVLSFAAGVVFLTGLPTLLARRRARRRS